MENDQRHHATLGEEFAKVFGSGADQIVLILQEGDNGPEIRGFTKPPNLGVCSLAVSYKDDDAGWDEAEKQFAMMDEQRARWFVQPLTRAGKVQA